ncbi:DUF2225 domain-containing protein [Anabaena sp. PCC 7108]|uniref:CHAT domain-containing tetratricopeptide repeat protein n=1 Tax=Anabaena sp. PCC 7108 TaxID=163908 RepID=UPI000347A277|nr:DUF2225 domain-containing protein [Anabaena sp. PCC 7108]
MLKRINYPPFILLGIFLFSPLNTASAEYKPVKIAQKLQTKRAAAEQAFQEGIKLYEQGTAPSLKQAIAKLETALTLFREAGEKPFREAVVLLRIGYIYSSLGEKQKALEYYKQALPIYRTVGNKEGEAATLHNIGSIYDSWGQRQESLQYYNQAVSLLRVVGDKAGEAITLNNIGLVYDSLGEKQKALEYYHQALSIYQVVSDKSGEATTLHNLGLVYSSLGKKQQALDYYNQSLQLLRGVGNKRGEAYSLSNIGSVYDSLGEKQQALDYYHQALTLRRAVGDKGGEAYTLNNLGSVYSSLGEKQQALDYYNQALLLLRAVGDRSKEATTLNNIGTVYDSQAEKEKALVYYNQALPLLRAVGDRYGEASTLHNIGAVYYSLNNNQQALNYYNQSLPLARAVGDKDGEAYTLTNLGSVYDSLGEKQKALEYYHQALPLRRMIGDRRGEAFTLYNLAYLQRKQGNLNEALIQMQTAIKIIENLRTKITNQDLRAAYFATFQKYYKFYIDLLMKLHKQQPSKGYDAQALQAGESARARVLLELLTEANADIRTGVDAKLLAAERQLQEQLDSSEKRRIQLLSAEPTRQQIQALETERTALLEQYTEIQTQIRATSPRYAALTQPQPLSLKQIQQEVLDEDTLLLEYSLGEEGSYLWAVSKTDMTSYELPKTTEIEAAVKNFRRVLTSSTSSPQKVKTAAAPVTQMLLAPVAQKLGNKRLVIVGDGALLYIPFAALTAPNSQGKEYQPLLVNHEIISLPSASTVAILRNEQKIRKTASKTLAVIADPVFTSNDQRITHKLPIYAKSEPQNLNNNTLSRAARDAGIDFDRLPFTRTEAKMILALVPENQRLQAFDFAATRDFATNLQLSEYRILHFATHGILNSQQPELSGVVLSLFDNQGQPQNGFLRLHDIFNLNLSAELVVLSACKTGLGKEIKGEGLIGLTNGFMYAGSPRVVVSLWNVDDQGTSVLMQKFYQKMLQQGLKPIGALRAAQLQMLTEKNKNLWKPYYWAAFTLQGEWR